MHAPHETPPAASSNAFLDFPIFWGGVPSVAVGRAPQNPIRIKSRLPEVEAYWCREAYTQVKKPREAYKIIWRRRTPGKSRSRFSLEAGGTVALSAQWSFLKGAPPRLQYGSTNGLVLRGIRARSKRSSEVKDP